jgi:hypothetical protein
MSMNDDELIRDAVHELVAASPSPKPLPMGGASGGGPYRWLTLAAAAVLVVGGIVAIAWSQVGDDDATPVATTQPAPLPTLPVSVATTPPATSSPVAVTVPPSTVPATTESTSTTSTSSTTTSTTSTTLPATPEQAQIEQYLAALAEGRYDEAAQVLNEGGLEPERRADLRPLYTEYGDIDDLPARLQAWCETEAICTPPGAGPTDTGNYWVATWPPDGSLTAYFRSGSFEGSPLVHGLPPRRLVGSVGTVGSPAIGCSPGVELVREADLDGDGWPETVIVQPGADSMMVLRPCNTGLDLPPLEFGPTGTPVVAVLQPASDPGATLLVGESNESGVCAKPHRMALSAHALIEVGETVCWGSNTGQSIGCRDVDGQSAIVTYRYSFVGGDRLDNSTGMVVDVLSLDGAPLDSFSLTLPDQIDEAFQIIEPYCNGLPVVTEG